MDLILHVLTNAAKIVSGVALLLFMFGLAYAGITLTFKDQRDFDRSGRKPKPGHTR
jgi:hypothetical protein